MQKQKTKVLIPCKYLGLETSIFKKLYVQVLIGIFLGIVVGYYFPSFATKLKPMGDIFVKIIKIIIAPTIFLTLSIGVAHMTDLRKGGKIVGKVFIYFLTLSTLALIVGLLSVNIFKPGVGLNIDPTSLDIDSIKTYVAKSQDQSFINFLNNIIPTTFVSAFVDENILQIIFVAILFGIALNLSGDSGKRITKTLEDITVPVFKIIPILMRLAPFGAFGAMSFAIGHYGIQSLINLIYLVLLFYATSAFFIFVVLGLICRYHKIPILPLLSYLKEEIILVLGSASSEAALPPLIKKMEDLGVQKSIIGIVIPLGYSFNLDGTNIYMTLSALFVAQSMNIHLSLPHQLFLLLIAMVSSKGAAGITGAGFITLAATLTLVPGIPVEGIVLILGVDRFMNECRSITNFIGNAIATLIISVRENQIDFTKMDRQLKNKI